MLHNLVDAPSGDTMDEGPFVIGYTMCFGLMGVLAVQAFIYFNRFPNDRTWMKTLVTVVFCLESLITIFAFHGFWTGVTKLGSDLSGIVAAGVGGQSLSPDPLWSYVAIAPLTGLVSFLTHGFFCWRIWVVGQAIIVPVLVMMVSLMQFSMVTYGAIKYGLVPDLNVDHPMPFYLPLWLCGSLLCDLTISVYMIKSLLQGKYDFQATKSLSIKLIKLTIETGAVTTTAALVELILAVAYRVTMYHLALFFIISKLYANCLLATLNARLALNPSLDSGKTVAVWDGSSHSGSHSGSGAGRSNHIQIHTRVETDVEMDPFPRVSHKSFLDA
ncbi:hypothetical protein BJ138DRAFT_1162188 [Hygrophoropsis aurantiaca]|uniref:Uncharacterized protein n=1 Tax=Hygrophoropsis aurantiaca TaxID=72124 RepID=A0ACB8A0H3_9AGAM|nr:hypothetical protein BJ138DRAFT_1162188 [Hygrophoropsis aurantiaca]